MADSLQLRCLHLIVSQCALGSALASRKMLLGCKYNILQEFCSCSIGWRQPLVRSSGGTRLKQSSLAGGGLRLVGTIGKVNRFYNAMSMLMLNSSRRKIGLKHPNSVACSQLLGSTIGRLNQPETAAAEGSTRRIVGSSC